jgi:zinc finger-like protein
VQEYLKHRQRGAALTSASSAAKAAVEAQKAAAAVDKTGYTPSWDDMFRMNRQQLEESARTLSRDDTLAPERKAYLMQHLLAARWICAQRRRRGGKDKDPPGANKAEEHKSAPGEAAASKDEKDAGAETDEPKDAGTARGDSDRPGKTGTSAEALAIAGASRAASYRRGTDANRPRADSAEDDGDDPGGSSPIVCPPAGTEFGCKHYSRKARLVAACCGGAHVCRFCHDEVEDHTIDRYATREMVCMLCSERQPSAKECRVCGEAMAKYYCGVCRFWDDSEDVYHCPFCNVCRRGKGLGKDFFHCMQCNSCVSLTMGPHVCSSKDGASAGGPGAMESDCPVCKDFLFTSDTPVKCLPCGHLMHTRCFESYTKHYYTCPLCRKSLGDFTAYFRMLDAILAEEREARGKEENGETHERQKVACNDCGAQTTAPFHFVYHACGSCRSYNTRVLGPGEEGGEARADT